MIWVFIVFIIIYFILFYLNILLFYYIFLFYCLYYLLTFYFNYPSFIVLFTFLGFLVVLVSKSIFFFTFYASVSQTLHWSSTLCSFFILSMLDYYLATDLLFGQFWNMQQTFETIKVLKVDSES